MLNFLPKFIFILVFTLMILALPEPAYANLRADKARPTRVQGQILVKFRSEASRSQRLNTLAARNHFISAPIMSSRPVVVDLAEGENIDDAIAAYESQSNEGTVEYAQPNYIYYALTVPNDPLYPHYWGLKNTGQTVSAPAAATQAAISTHNPGASGSDMNLEGAWEKITDCSSVVVAVVDTGVNYNHSDLSANMWNGGASYPKHGYDFIDNDNDPMDLAGHGTHVAGTIGAVGNNAVGGTGVCWKVQLMAVRVLDATGSGTTSQIASGIDFAANNGAKVINLSLGGSTFDNVMRDAIKNAATKGALVVAAAGNDGKNNESVSSYPCNYNEANEICVAAIDQSNELASFSNYGSTKVHVGAPGVNIVSSWNGTFTENTDALDGTGWTLATNGGTGWGFPTFTSGGTTYPLIANPSNWDGASKKYANSSADIVYKTFDLSAGDAHTLSFYAFYQFEPGVDGVYVSCNKNGGDPFGTGRVDLDAVSGSTAGSFRYHEYDLAPCKGASATIGFKLVSDSSINKLGMAATLFHINKLTLGSTSYDILEGTSMATPHVSGLAAMIFAYNPSYTFANAKEAILNGGTTVSSLSGKTSTGKAVNALGSLSYITAPKSVTLTVK